MKVLMLVFLQAANLRFWTWFWSIEVFILTLEALMPNTSESASKQRTEAGFNNPRPLNPVKIYGLLKLTGIHVLVREASGRTQQQTTDRKLPLSSSGFLSPLEWLKRTLCPLFNLVRCSSIKIESIKLIAYYEEGKGCLTCLDSDPLLALVQTQLIRKTFPVDRRAEQEAE